MTDQTKPVLTPPGAILIIDRFKPHSPLHYVFGATELWYGSDGKTVDPLSDYLLHVIYRERMQAARSAALVRAAATRPWWLDNYKDRQDRDYRVCLGCRREWYADHGSRREHGVLCPFTALDAAVDATKETT